MCVEAVSWGTVKGVLRGLNTLSLCVINQSQTSDEQGGGGGSWALTPPPPPPQKKAKALKISAKLGQVQLWGPSTPPPWRNLGYMTCMPL